MRADMFVEVAPYKHVSTHVVKNNARKRLESWSWAVLEAIPIRHVTQVA